MLTSLFIAILPIYSQTPSDRYPSRVMQVLQGGTEKTSEVTWALSWLDGVNDGLVEQFLTRRAGSEIWESNYGDERGYHPIEYSGQPDDLSGEALSRHEIPREESAGIRNTMIHEEHLWHLPRAEAPLSGQVTPLKDARANLPVNPLSIGLAPSLLNELDATPFRIPYPFADGFETAVFEERKDRQGHTVSAEYAGGMFRLTWRFDDRFGGQPVAAMLEREGELAYHSETDYEKNGDRWLPTETRFYKGNSASPYKVLEIKKASFDDPGHLQEFDPSDMGALYGTQFLTPTGLKMWTGSELISNTDFWDLVYLYDAPPDPGIVQLIADELGMSKEEYEDFLRRGAERRRAVYKRDNRDEPWSPPKMKKEEQDPWDLYLKKFLLDHKLPEKAVELAHDITRKAKKVRDAHRHKYSDALRKAEKERDERKLKELEKDEERIYKRLLVKPLNKLAEQANKDSVQQAGKG